MHWLYFLIAWLCLMAAMIRSLPTAAVLVLVFASLGFFLAWVIGWFSSRVSSRARDDIQIISPDELRRMREQAEARRAAGESGKSDPQAPD